MHRLSTIGSKGKHLQNCERDLQFAVTSFARAMKADIIIGRCRMWDPSENCVVSTELMFIDPVSLAAALYKKGPHVFRQCFFGDLTDEQVLAYWQKGAANSEWFRKSHAAEWGAESLTRLAPLSLYGDDVNSYRNTEAGNISIVSFCSDLARGNGPFLRYFLISLYSEYTASVHTYDDLMATCMQAYYVNFWL